MRISVLASGSGGNAVVAVADGTRVLIDCGLSLRQLQRRMREVGLEPAAIDALLVTHEHSDHVRGVELFVRRHPVPVLATAGTAEALGGELSLDGVLRSGHAVEVGALRLIPVATSHDAREPVGFVIEHGRCRAAVVTDTGVATQLLVERLAGCHALLVECNHDPDMLRWGPYPWPLKQRIASRTGHLSNEQTRDLLEVLAHGGLELVVGMHLSRENNRPELVSRELMRPLEGAGVRIAVADQFAPLVVEVAGPARERGGA